MDLPVVGIEGDDSETWHDQTGEVGALRHSLHLLFFKVSQRSPEFGKVLSHCLNHADRMWFFEKLLQPQLLPCCRSISCCNRSFVVVAAAAARDDDDHYDDDHDDDHDDDDDDDDDEDDGEEDEEDKDEEEGWDRATGREEGRRSGTGIISRLCNKLSRRCRLCPCSTDLLGTFLKEWTATKALKCCSALDKSPHAVICAAKAMSLLTVVAYVRVDGVTTQRGIK